MGFEEGADRPAPVQQPAPLEAPSRAWVEARIELSNLRRRLIDHTERRAMLALRQHQRAADVPLSPIGDEPVLLDAWDFELALRSAAEGEAFRRELIDDLSEVRRSQLHGSSWRFYDETNRILSQSALAELATELAHRRDACLAETLVSVILPLDEKREAAWALASVLGQSYPRLEVLLIDDGGASREFLTVATSDDRVHVVGKAAGGQRGPALRQARGSYVAFISAAAEWAPDKIERQLEIMAKAGALASCTRYNWNGDVTPDDSPVHTDTVMIHRALIAGGFALPEDDGGGWSELAGQGRLLRIDAPLCAFKGPAVER